MEYFQTTMLDATTKIEKITKTLSFVKINAYDFPGKFNMNEAPLEELPNFEGCKAVIFVIDAQVLPSI